MIKIAKAACCGCGACVAACSRKCIELQEDKEGFLYPHINIQQCISCRYCEKVCPCLETGKKNDYREAFTPVAVGGSHKDEKVLKNSSSGGAFTLFANEIIKCGGVVYGCALDQDIMPIHIGCSNIREIGKLRRAKYVQSVSCMVFNDIKEALEEGKEVLFTGTPCECAGLSKFLGKKYTNLYLCDFVCHGVPSRGIFRAWKEYQENKYRDKIQNVLFRNKEFGWKSCGMQMGTKIVFSKYIKERVPSLFDPYMNGFLEDIYLRPSCYSCIFKGPRVYSDITISDFWGVKRIDEEIYNRKGTSLVIFNTPKGRKLFERVKGNFKYKTCDLKEALFRNKSYFESARPNPKRKQFFDDYEEKGIEYVIKNYMMPWHWIKYRLFGRKRKIRSSNEI